MQVATIGCSVVSDFVTLWTLALQASLFMEFSRQEYWSLLSCPTPGDLPNPGIVPGSPALQVDSLLLSHEGSPNKFMIYEKIKKVKHCN